MSEVQSAKVGKLSERAGNPVFSPSRLLAAICKVAPQFKVYCNLRHEADIGKCRGRHSQGTSGLVEFECRHRSV